MRRITNEILGVKELGSRWDYSARTQIVKEGTISNLHPCYIGMHSFSADKKCVIFLIDVILKVSKFPVMIRTDAFCFGDFLLI